MNRMPDSKIYDNDFLGGNQVGSIENGKIYMGTGLGKEYVGRIDEKGNIYNDSPLGGDKIGRVDENGKIYIYIGLGKEYVGRIDKKGNIYNDGILGGDKIGRVDKNENDYDDGHGIEVPPIDSTIIIIAFYALLFGLIEFYSKIGFTFIMGLFTTIIFIIIIAMIVCAFIQTDSQKRANNIKTIAIIISLLIAVDGVLYFEQIMNQKRDSEIQRSFLKERIDYITEDYAGEYNTYGERIVIKENGKCTFTRWNMDWYCEKQDIAERVKGTYELLDNPDDYIDPKENNYKIVDKLDDGLPIVIRWDDGDEWETTLQRDSDNGKHTLAEYYEKKGD